MDEKPKIFVADEVRNWLGMFKAGVLVVLIMLLLLGVCVSVIFFNYNSASDASKTIPKMNEALSKPAVSKIEFVPEPVQSVKPAQSVEVEPDFNKRQILDAMSGHLLAHLPLLNSFRDHSHNELPVEVTGTVEITDDGARFAGDGFLTLPHLPFNERPFAVAVWIKPEGLVNGYGLLEQNAGGDGRLLHILLRDPDRPMLAFYANDLQAMNHVTAELGWTHLVFQYTGTVQQIWMNGKKVAERTADAYHGKKGATFIGKVPRWNNVTTTYYVGLMKDVRIYNMALNETQIAVLSGGVAQPGHVEKPAKEDNF